MEHLSEFCTCKRTKCPLHPVNHNKGCAPCIQKNLKTKQMPSCFFNLLDSGEKRGGDSFEEFANIVLNQQEEER